MAMKIFVSYLQIVLANHHSHLGHKLIYDIQKKKNPKVHSQNSRIVAINALFGAFLCLLGGVETSYTELLPSTKHPTLFIGSFKC